MTKTSVISGTKSILLLQINLSQVRHALPMQCYVLNVSADQKVSVIVRNPKLIFKTLLFNYLQFHNSSEGHTQ